MNISVGSRTDTGMRDNNEDAVAVLIGSELGLSVEAVLIVADGMGGRAYGERASSSAVESVQETLSELLATSSEKAAPVSDALATALRRANSRVYDLAAENPGKQAMGTTCTTAVIAGDKLFLGHVGDSRAYLLRDDILRRITTDHSYVAEQMRAGQLSDHDARRSRFKNIITKAIGIEPTITPDIDGHVLREGDTILLCTDGLTGTINEAGITGIILQSGGSAQTASDYLVEAAMRGGARDNVSVIVAFVGGAAATAASMRIARALSKPAAGNGQARKPRPAPRMPLWLSAQLARARAELPKRIKALRLWLLVPGPWSAWLAVGLLLGALIALTALWTGHVVRVAPRFPFVAPVVRQILPAPPAVPAAPAATPTPAVPPSAGQERS